MAGVITTSIVVQFGSEDDEQFHLSAEIDDRDDGFNSGITKFIPGDSPVFMVYKSPELNLTLDSSTGGTNNVGTGLIEQVEYITFANEKSKALSKPVEGTATVKYLDGTVGGVILNGELVIPDVGIAAYKITYNARYYAYQMVNIPLQLAGEIIFPVVVVIVGTSEDTP